MWVKFDDLSPEQAVVAQQQLAASVEVPLLKKTHLRDFLVVDGQVKGSRLSHSKEDRKLLAEIFGWNVRSKTDLKDWKSTPTPFHMNYT